MKRALVLLAFLVAIVLAQKAGDKLVATDNLNVRVGPCTDQRIITTIAKGTTVTYDGASQSGCGYKWFRIKGSFGTGWAASNYLRPDANCKVKFNPPLFKQCDSRWANDRLGKDSTICKVGCLMTSVAMAMNGLGKKINGAAVTPKNLNQFLLANGGYSGNLYVWAAISRFGFNYQGQPTNIQTISNYICNNAVVILNIDKGGHWVLATGVNGNTFYINDPGRTRTSVSASEVLRAGVYTH
jgi:uncharacterized protein YvpB